MIQHEDLIEVVIAGHVARNVVWHRRFLNRGGNDQLIRPFDLFFHCPDELNARHLARALSAERVERAIVLEPDGDSGWEVHGVFGGSLLELIDPGFTEQLVRLANSRSATYMGWMSP